MSFVASAVVATVVGAGFNELFIKPQKDAADEAKKARQEAAARADAAAQKADQDFNRLNKKKPNIHGIMDANAASAAGSTMLTGPQGIDPNALLLGKNTLLGS